MCMYVGVRRERKKWNSLSLVKRWNWRLDGEEEWLGLPWGTMVRSQSELLLRAMPGSMAMQGSGSVSDVRGSPENAGVPLVREVTGDHVDVQGLRRTYLTSHQLQHSGELAPPPTWQQHSRALLLTQEELTLVVGVWVSQPREWRV